VGGCELDSSGCG